MKAFGFGVGHIYSKKSNYEAYPPQGLSEARRVRKVSELFGN